MNKLVLQTPRFILKPLSIADVTQSYCDWFHDKTTKTFIEAAKETQSLETLKNYVAKRSNRPDVLFLGIFTRANQHIGNLKYEPIDKQQGFAIMGILIGEPEWRNKGVTYEALHVSARYLQKIMGIRYIALGVELSNIPAIIAYEKVGFIEQKTPAFIKTNRNSIQMVLSLKDLKNATTV